MMVCVYVFSPQLHNDSFGLQLNPLLVFSDDLDLFGEEVDEEAEKLKQQRLAEVGALASTLVC